MTLTDDPANRIPFARPPDYDERRYELLFRNYESGERLEELPWINSRMPNHKTDTNNRRGFSTDFIGQNHAWPDASYEEREAIFRAHLSYQQGLMWTLANHPRVPQPVRDIVSRWGLCRDEFVENGGWTPQLYIREARRLVGAYVMTEHNCTKREVAPHPIALAAYQMDSHNVRRYVTDRGLVRNEGMSRSAVRRVRSESTTGQSSRVGVNAPTCLCRSASPPRTSLSVRFVWSLSSLRWDKRLARLRVWRWRHYDGIYHVTSRIARSDIPQSRTSCGS